MSEVTREDVAERLFYIARRDDWGVANDEEKAEFYDQADALIAAFPHLIESAEYGIKWNDAARPSAAIYETLDQAQAVLDGHFKRYRETGRLVQRTKGRLCGPWREAER